MENSVTPIKSDELASKMQQLIDASQPAGLKNNASKAQNTRNLKRFNLDLSASHAYLNGQSSTHHTQYVTPQGVQQRIAAIFAPGKSLRERIRAVPVLGYGLACLAALMRLPKTLQHQQVQHHALLERLEKIHVVQAELQRTLLDLEAVLKPNFDEIEQHLQSYDYLEVGKRLMQLEKIESARKFRSMTLLMQELQKQVQVQQAQIQTNANFSAETQPEDENSLDQFFADFEAKFRGSRTEILQRLRAYLPYLENELRTPIEQRRRFVDVGCGRGEWLELMSEMDIPCLGVDLNTAKVEECVAQNLAAIATDAIAYLKQQEANSLGGVTGFHIIEHLPFPILVELFDAAFHALAPGGVLIFETPNPENLIVGACNFYYDPTHLNPIVPDVAQFIAQQRGFSSAQIKRLHPFPDDYQMSGNTALDQTLNKFLFSAQDYALIARK